MLRRFWKWWTESWRQIAFTAWLGMNFPGCCSLRSNRCPCVLFEVTCCRSFDQQPRSMFFWEVSFLHFFGRPRPYFFRVSVYRVSRMSQVHFCCLLQLETTGRCIFIRVFVFHIFYIHQALVRHGTVIFFVNCLKRLRETFIFIVLISNFRLSLYATFLWSGFVGIHILDWTPLSETCKCLWAPEQDYRCKLLHHLMAIFKLSVQVLLIFHDYILVWKAWQTP